MKFLYYLAAIGGPRLDDKLKILTRNLLYINQTLQQNFSIVINCYNHVEEISKFIKQFTFLDAILFHYRPNSVLTELWFTNPYIKIINTFDEILFILDDVSISRLNISKLINIRKANHLDIISPSVIGATHKYMYSQSANSLALTNHLEIYCMIITPEVFKKYLSLNSFENKWIWGVDALFGHFGVKTAVYYGMNVFHLIPSGGNGGHGQNDEAEAMMITYLQNHGFQSLEHVHKVYPPIRQVIAVK
tara:strand:+ start:1000 stop:1740 length:741 start_codon:yes stop_codon:yes gene_type:complete